MAANEEIDPDEPIAALAHFEQDTSTDLIAGTRRTIERRTVVAQFTSVAAILPIIVIREFWLVFKHNSVR
jgi:hypothetical protein